MNEVLKNLLQEKGFTDLTDEQISGILKLGVRSAEDMQWVTEEDLTKLGVPVITGRKIAATFKPKPEPTAVSPAPVPTGPIQVTVQPQATLPEMEIKQLLERLVGNPADDAALDELRSRDQFRAAYAKDPRVAVIEGTNGPLNVPATLKYWQFLRKGQPQSRWESKRVVTIEKALGRIERLLLHPLVARETIYMGTDTYGCDWTKVSPDRMEAAYWARTTEHAMFPKSMDPLDTYEALAAETLSKRWQTIVEDYLAQIEDHGRVNLLASEGGRGPSDQPFRPSRFEV